MHMPYAPSHTRTLGPPGRKPAGRPRRSFIGAGAALGLGLALTLGVSSFQEPLDADCPCAGGEVEVVYIIDCSGSMNHVLGTIQEQVKLLHEALQGQVRKLRAAVVIYRTFEYTGPRKKLEVFPLSSDIKALHDFLKDEAAEGGGAELVDDGLDLALNELKWTKGARKIAMLFGDEQAEEDRQPRCMELAKQFKERGITLHTFTGSQTAWIYWGPLHEKEWRGRVADMGTEKAKSTFRLPYFDDLAEAGGGISVSMANSRDLVLWVLGFCMGYNEDQTKARVDVTRYFDWAKEHAAQGGGASGASEPGAKELPPNATLLQQYPEGLPLVGWIRHNGDWNPSRDWKTLFGHLKQRLELSGAPVAHPLGLLDADLERFPVLYLTGHGPIKWSYPEALRLRAQLLRGGFLFADACCADKDFIASVQKFVADHFPDRKLERLEAAHPIFSAGHVLEKVKQSAALRTNTFIDLDPELWGLFLPDPTTGKTRLALVLSPHGLGCGWHTRPLGAACQIADPDALKLSANIFLYALTR